MRGKAAFYLLVAVEKLLEHHLDAEGGDGGAVVLHACQGALRSVEFAKNLGMGGAKLGQRVDAEDAHALVHAHRLDDCREPDDLGSLLDVVGALNRGVLGCWQPGRS